MNRPLVGFSMHPRWIYGSTLAGFLGRLRTAGLEALEFGLDANDADWPCFEPMMDDCRLLGFSLCFHAPYKPPYTIAGFAGHGRANIEADYAAMLDVAARFGDTTVVIHGAQSATRPQQELNADTVAFLRWALGRYPSLTLALENLVFDPDKVKIGADRTEVLRIVEEINDSRLGICWDLGHDVVNGCYDLPNQAWLQHICHAHLHDVSDQGVDHYPLIYGRVPIKAWLPALLRAGFSGIVSLELKGGQLASLEPEQIMEMLIDSTSEVHRLLKIAS